ncbi:hypothetical protein BH09BAC2_BH09BAC2_08010 [soil metagenome]
MVKGKNILKFALIFTILGCAISSTYAQSETGIINSTRRFGVHPNPASNIVLITSEGDIYIKELLITNSQGLVMTYAKFTDNRRSATVDVSKYQPGDYKVSISDGLVSETQTLSVAMPLCPPYCPMSPNYN